MPCITSCYLNTFIHLPLNSLLLTRKSMRQSSQDHIVRQHGCTSYLLQVYVCFITVLSLWCLLQKYPQHCLSAPYPWFSTTRCWMTVNNAPPVFKVFIWKQNLKHRPWKYKYMWWCVLVIITSSSDSKVQCIPVVAHFFTCWGSCWC